MFERLVDEQMRKCMASSRDLILAKHALAGLAAIDKDYGLGMLYPTERSGCATSPLLVSTALVPRGPRANR